MNQAGSGIAGFQGVRYQRGSGFMGRMITGTVMPILKKILPFLGRTALKAGTDILQDFENGDKFSDSAKRRLKETKESIKMKAVDKFKELTGSSRRKTKPKTKRSNKRQKLKKSSKKITKRKQKSKQKSHKTQKKKCSAFDFL